ncbi:MAG: signal peptide peptidase SppA [Elusimicrobia bacterium]|nr:signal peptide peptidase SppA [Elusimicrobiota bacterium]
MGEDAGQPEFAPQSARNSKKKILTSPALLGLLYAASLVAAVLLVFVSPKTPAVEDSRKIAPSKVGLSFLNIDGDAIGLVKLDGLIAMDRQGFWGDTMIDRTRKSLERLAKKKQVKAIVLRINSPGGTVAASQELYRAIGELRKKHNKPIIALLGDVAASGGYYVACACDKIVAEPGTITGSIGVIFQTTHFDALAKRFGVGFNTIKSGLYKDIGNPARPMTLEERRILQSLVDTAYKQFVKAVADGRGYDFDRAKKLADGRIMIGEGAQAVGLVDEISGHAGAIRLAKELGKIKGEPKIIRDVDFREDLIEELLQGRADLQFLNFLQKKAVPASGLLYLWTGY